MATPARSSAWAILIAFLAAPAPAAAQEPVNSEPLVTRLIFDDCLSYVRDDTAPFAGLSLTPIRPEVDAGLPAPARDLPNRHQLLSDRYYTYWGVHDGKRLCVIGGVDDYARFPALLSFPVTGFLDRLSQRAAQAGLTDQILPKVFSADEAPVFSEPGDDPGEARIVVMPYEPALEGTLVDIGIIIVASGVPGAGS